MSQLNTTFKQKSNGVFNNALFSAQRIVGMKQKMHEQMERLYRAAKDLKGIDGQTELAVALNTSPQRVKNWEITYEDKYGREEGRRKCWVTAAGMGIATMFFVILFL